jgi:hypothetical protein
LNFNGKAESLRNENKQFSLQLKQALPQSCDRFTAKNMNLPFG